MKGDFSRDTFDRRKRYRGVLMQQGRVQLDADWNEQLSLQFHRTHTQAVDVIGRCGVPRGASGFLVEPLGVDDLRLSAGRLYAGGLLCEIEDGQSFAAAAVTGQPNRLSVGAEAVRSGGFAIGRWIEISAPGRASITRRVTATASAGTVLTLHQQLAGFNPGDQLRARAISTYTTQPFNRTAAHTADATSGNPPVPDRRLELPDGVYVAYLHAWQQHVTALDDPQMREKALGGPDTATRVRDVWQVNLLRVTPPAGQPTCATEFPEWTNLTRTPDGLMNARVGPVEDDEDPCTVPPEAGYRRLENQLYRVEIHRGGARGEATFKWSRENGSVETSVVGVNDETVTVSYLHDDDVLGFKSEDWVEVVDEQSELDVPAAAPRQLLRITELPDLANKQLTLSGSVESLAGRPGLKLRRWDQKGDNLGNGIPLVSADADPTAPGWIRLEGGVQVRFSGNSFRAGDYWLIPARTATGMIEWPPFDAQGAQPEPQPPRGVEHHYCRLALVTAAGGAVTALDCRDIFPPLTDITAEDVSFDNAQCLPELEGVTNVQEAIEHLCHERQGACTFVVAPSAGWEQVFERVGAGRDAEICFQAGEFPLPAGPVRVAGKGHLKLTGARRGTRILAPAAEAALAFENCASVTVRDLYAETGVTDAGAAATEHLNGTLTFRNCGAVEVEGVALRCGAGPTRASACVTVRNDPPAPESGQRPGAARVRGCELEVGHRQQGVLLVNVERAQVEDNVVRVYEKPESLRLQNAARDARARASIRRIFITGASLTVEPPPGGRTNVRLQSGNAVIHFRAHPAVRNAWQALLRENPGGQTSPRALLLHARSLADRVLTDAAFRTRFRAFDQLFRTLEEEDRAVGAQGITIGGVIAPEARVLNNTVEGVLQGVHIGLSIRPGQQDVAGALLVEGNRIHVVLPPDAAGEDRYGIFVGNCDSLVVENNHLRLQRLGEAARLRIDGIRVWGAFGKRLIVAQNHVASFTDATEDTPKPQTGFDVGIRVNPLNASQEVRQWVVMWNVAPCKTTTVIAPNSVLELNNVP
jgi:hypothetical protein